MHAVRSPRPSYRDYVIRTLASLCQAFTLFAAPPSRAAVSPASLEQAVKANYLFKFAPFVDWPSGVFPPAEKKFLICVVGEDPFGRILDDVVRGEKMVGRPVIVRRLDPAADPAGCHILFAGRSPVANYAPFGPVNGKPVLTVGDRDGGPPGAMIQFVMQAGRVRFQIDDRSARACGIRISSKLLGLAISVDKK